MKSKKIKIPKKPKVNLHGPVGYSTKTLAQKLGLKELMSKAVLYAPPGFCESIGIEHTGYDAELEMGHYQFIVFFVTSRVLLQNLFPILAKRLDAGGLLWIAWPKKAAKGMSDYPQTDITENLIREVGLPTGLVDVKVIAIDEIWSGLKFMHRTKAPLDFEEMPPKREIPPVQRFGL